MHQTSAEIGILGIGTQSSAEGREMYNPKPEVSVVATVAGSSDCVYCPPQALLAKEVTTMGLLGII